MNVWILIAVANPTLGSINEIIQIKAFVFTLKDWSNVVEIVMPCSIDSLQANDMILCYCASCPYEGTVCIWYWRVPIFCCRKSHFLLGSYSLLIGVSQKSDLKHWPLRILRTNIKIWLSFYLFIYDMSVQTSFISLSGRGQCTRMIDGSYWRLNSHILYTNGSVHDDFIPYILSY